MLFNTTSWRNRLKHAFAVPSPENEITDDDRALAHKVAVFVVKRRLTGPALMVLETSRPINFISSQFLVFLSPFVSIIFSNTKDYEHFVRFLEKRASIDCMIQHIEDQENRRHG
jgi:hypothetical protein